MPYLNSLRNRFIITLAIMLVLVMGILMFILHQLMIPNLLSEERQGAHVYANVLQESIDRDARNLNTMVYQWATWAGTWEFMNGRRPDFPQTHITPAVFDDHAADLMIITNPNDAISWIAGRNPVNGSFTSCAQPAGDCQWSLDLVREMQRQLSSTDTMPRIGVRPDFAMISTWPITRRDSSFAAGKITLMRLLPGQWQPEAGLSTLTLSSIRLKKGDRHDDKPAISIEPIDDDTLRLTLTRPSATPEYQVLMTTRLKRDGLHAGIARFNMTMLGSLLLLIALMMAMLWVFRAIVLRPITELSRYASALRQSPGEHLEAPPPWLQARSDELGNMAREFQTLIKELNERNAHLKALTNRDALTGLGNRRLLDRQLPRTLSLTHRLERPVALIMIDVDHFKLYNDFYGHPEGDQCLKTIAETLSDIFQRESDLVTRVGGEEFVIVLPDFDLERAMDIARGVCTAMEAQCIPHVPSPTHKYVTISAGVAISSPDHPLSGEALIKQADQALYQIKKSSRNAVGCTTCD
ncbi:diguanylate cyclase (GGDEF) domain-containing protein [Kushneria avicenniae]|uniref:diguanylate cyclase n=1 Tax=Kushneria avicenniae TaxID=402385 RepID=A0A1I1KTF2_9GAMM|nr:diguanylate cyclase [Kushneria avicenniae]SFC64104.1 diguanylate cyclase (GGDEF) domain-containing protein [Kushneria avicenniae]